MDKKIQEWINQIDEIRLEIHGELPWSSLDRHQSKSASLAISGLDNAAAFLEDLSGVKIDEGQPND